MSRQVVNAVVDAVAFAAFVLLTATGVLMRYVLPPGSGHFSTLWGMDRHDWGQIHFWIAAALMGALGAHIFLHWRWIVCTIRGRPREGSGLRVALAIVGMLALVSLAGAPFLAPVEPTGEAPHKMRTADQAGGIEHQVDGSMTLQEVEQSTGVPAAMILKELGLLAGVPTDERLGRLRRKYSFEMNDIRAIIQKHHERQNSEAGK